jgi:tRNA-uridine 2-sulfurtransferase
VRTIAEQHQLPTSGKPESMEICFVPDGDYAGFIERVAGPRPSGPIVDRAARVLGEHQGLHRYTVGQRRGLGSHGAKPMYVQRIDAASNQIVVGPSEDSARSSFSVTQAHWVCRAPAEDQSVRVRIRHRHPGAIAKVRLEANGNLKVHLDAPVKAITPGQAAVFYDGSRVLGGGWIS